MHRLLQCQNISGVLGCIALLTLSGCGREEQPAPMETSTAPSIAAPVPKAVYTVQINNEPLFEKQGDWSDGYKLAAGHGAGVVVGPGPGNPNVFAQKFAARPGEHFKVIARAASVDANTAVARFQINWSGTADNFISVWSETFDVKADSQVFEKELEAPPGAAFGALYVVGDAESIVRYTEMRLLGQEGNGQ
jgi:hypothetical protein